jgi:predicted SnoaL-like aldol condensation-catalyzing enzyme
LPKALRRNKSLDSCYNILMETNKKIAISFLQMVASGQVREAYEKYVSPDFRHHNAYFKGDRESLLVAMEEAQQNDPMKALEIKSALADGDQVAVFSHVKQNSQDRGVAVVHIFRIEGNQIIELWDVGQLIPEDSPNENGMF